MSDESLALAERFFEEGMQGDLADYLAFIDPDAVFDFTELDRPYARVYRGHEEIEQLYRELSDPWSERRFETSDPVAVGEHVVIEVTRTVRSRQSSLGVLSSLTALLELHEGRIVSFKFFLSRADALAAAGLARQPS